MNRLYNTIGTMSGTSCDGIDISVIRTDGDQIIDSIYNKFFPYNNEFRKNLVGLGNDKFKASHFLVVERKITLLHFEAIKSVMDDCKNISINLIGFHGHTIVHCPKDSVTWQIGNATLLASLCKKNVICDFRLNDMCYGGEGAPITPIFHKNFFSNLLLKKDFFVVNIGGIANITYINGFDIFATDVGPGNCIIDDILFNRVGFGACDFNGEISSKGIINYDLVQLFLINNKIKKLESLDRNQFDTTDFNNLTLEDALATASYITALFISMKIKEFVKERSDCNILIAGGGRKNKSIIKNLSILLPDFVLQNVDEYKLNGDFLESSAMAYLAVRSVLNYPYTYKKTTGNIIESCKGGTAINYKK